MYVCVSETVIEWMLLFRLERERLAERLRQKEVLERELNRERSSLQEQLIKQAKLNEVIRQKDLFEKELVKEKNELQVCNSLDSSRCYFTVFASKLDSNMQHTVL